MDKRMKKLAEKSVTKISVYQKVFSGPDGQAVLLDLMAAHGMLQSTYTGDVHQMLIKEGERNAVLRILKLLNTDPKQLMERIKEHEAEMVQFNG